MTWTIAGIDIGAKFVSIRNSLESFVMSVFEAQSAKVGAALLAAAQIGASIYLSTQGDASTKYLAARDAAFGYAKAVGVTIGEQALDDALETLLHLNVADAHATTAQTVAQA